ncbi:MAG: hypothetical protein IJ781_04150 [Atopobiaceae bacterium]|nr:hypothetical protein [Atopobiaceae bacterium]
MGGKAFGWYKTVAFPLVASISGEQVRVRLCNRQGALRCGTHHGSLHT